MRADTLLLFNITLEISMAFLKRKKTYNFVLIPNGSSCLDSALDLSARCESFRRIVGWSFEYCLILFAVRQLEFQEVTLVTKS